MKINQYVADTIESSRKHKIDNIVKQLFIDYKNKEKSRIP